MFGLKQSWGGLRGKTRTEGEKRNRLTLTPILTRIEEEKRRRLTLTLTLTETIILRVGAPLGRKRGVGFSLKNKERENRTRQEEKKRR